MDSRGPGTVKGAVLRYVCLFMMISVFLIMAILVKVKGISLGSHVMKAKSTPAYLTWESGPFGEGRGEGKRGKGRGLGRGGEEILRLRHTVRCWHCWCLKQDDILNVVLLFCHANPLRCIPASHHVQLELTNFIICHANFSRDINKCSFLCCRFSPPTLKHTWL